MRSPWLGIVGLAVDEEVARVLELGIDRGVYVVSVVPESPADRAGLRGGETEQEGQPAAGGDVITWIDDMEVSSVEDIITYLNTKKPAIPF